MKKKLLGIGEALIDFAPEEVGCGVKDVEHFMPKVGGAPANVCGAFTTLGGEASMLTMLGEDPFADKIIQELDHYGIDTSNIKRTKKANTSLAFVAIEEDGNREFSFYRNMGADMLMSAEDVDERAFEDAYALHFCSVSLGDFPMRQAHDQAIAYARKNGAIISFDPNIRLPLWENHELLYQRIWSYMKKSDIVKISDEEVKFITGETEIEKALPKLFVGDVKLIIYTMGGHGAKAFTKNAKAGVASEPVKAVDTTGAGDGFIGAFLYQLYEEEKTVADIENLTPEFLEKSLRFSDEFCRRSVMKHGALASYSK